MNLAIDFGNSLVKAAIFQNDELILQKSWQKLSIGALQQLTRALQIDGAIVSSVTNDSQSIEEWLRKRYHFVKLTPRTPVTVKNHYETPGTLGTDRLAGMVAANDMFPKKNVLVIGAGTCITYDVIRKSTDYFGGNITPGLDMRLRAMHTFTDRLPLIQKQFTSELFGKNTASAILTGAITGAVMELNGFIEAYKKRFSPLMVVLTGGDAPIFESRVKTKIFAVPNLVLYGLNKILLLNEPG